MPRFRSRRLTPVSTALLVWEIYRRLPRQQRRWVRVQARRHGPRLARHVMASVRKR